MNITCIYTVFSGNRIFLSIIMYLYKKITFISYQFNKHKDTRENLTI